MTVFIKEKASAHKNNRSTSRWMSSFSLIRSFSIGAKKHEFEQDLDNDNYFSPALSPVNSRIVA